MNTLSYKTKSATNETVQRQWFVIDAEGVVLGRLATQVATILRGKHKPSFTPNIDTGDYVIILNSDKVVLSGTKMDDKQYIHHTGYPGGQRSLSAKALNAKNPLALVEIAVRGMLPKTKLGRAMFGKLFVYAEGEHPHTAQKPQTLTIQ
ncbi:50S ribosomal protein L13 [soil metagenome]